MISLKSITCLTREYESPSNLIINNLRLWIFYNSTQNVAPATLLDQNFNFNQIVMQLLEYVQYCRDPICKNSTNIVFRVIITLI